MKTVFKDELYEKLYGQANERIAQLERQLEKAIECIAKTNEQFSIIALDVPGCPTGCVCPSAIGLNGDCKQDCTDCITGAIREIK